MLIAIWNSTVSGLLDDRMAAAGHSLLGDITAVFDANLAGEHDDAIRAVSANGSANGALALDRFSSGLLP